MAAPITCCKCTGELPPLLRIPWPGTSHHTCTPIIKNRLRKEATGTHTKTALQLRRKNWNLSFQLHEPQIYTSTDDCINSALVEHPNGKRCSHSLDRSSFSKCGLCGHVHMSVGPDQRLSCFHRSHSSPRCMNTSFLVVISVDLHWWPSEKKNAWDTPRPITDMPTVKVGLREVPTTVYSVNQHNQEKVTQQSMLTREEIQWSGSSPNESAATHIPCTSDQKHSSETDLGASAPITRKQTLPLTGQWQPQSKQKALLYMYIHICVLIYILYYIYINYM